MALFVTKSVLPASSSSSSFPYSHTNSNSNSNNVGAVDLRKKLVGGGRSIRLVHCVSNTNNNSNSDAAASTRKGVPNSNYVVPLDKSFSSSYSSCITRPLVEILRDLNKKIADNIITKSNDSPPHVSTFIPWYHANRMLSFYAPGWCGEIRDVIFSDNGTVTVVYRVTIRGSDGEAHRESTGTVSSNDGHIADPVAAAEEIAFCKACARFGLGLYLYHEE